jgi:lysophospholipase L1-like esterase
LKPSAWTLRALLVLLAPVLLAQGRHTRAATPRLPEPPGPRTGRVGQGPVLRLLIAGDSAAAGVGASHQHAALSGRLADSLAPHFDLHWQLIAQTGYTTRDLLQRLAQQPAQSFDAVVLSTGVNDVTAPLRTHAWLAQQRELVGLIRQRFGAHHLVLTRVPPMHRFTALPQPLRQLLGWRAQGFNEALAAALCAWPEAAGCELLHVTPPTTPDALATDGFHPGEASYRLWADAVAQCIRASWGRR